MQRKIKNLTLMQVKKLCEQHNKIIDGKYQCDKCPFGDKYQVACKLDYHYLDEYGEEKVDLE